MEKRTFAIGNIRPPFHANSLLLQVTENCTWNRCNFCTLYRGGQFKMRSAEDVKRDIDTVAYYRDKIFEKYDGKDFDMDKIMREYSSLSDDEKNCYAMVFNWIRSDNMKTVFLQDANTTSIRLDVITDILRHLRKTLPSLEVVSSYGRADTLTRLDVDGFKALKEAGLTMIHSGYESGCNDVLKLLNKGTTREQQIEAGQKIKAAGIDFNVFYMPGSGGKALSERNAIETADVINQIDPEYIRIRTFVVKPQTPMWEIAKGDDFQELTDIEKLQELVLMTENLKGIKSYLISDHIINLLPRFEGYINKDKEDMLRYAKEFLNLPKNKQMEFQLARRLCYNVDYNMMNYMPSEDMTQIREVIKNISSPQEWEELLRRYLRQYI